MTAEVIPPGKQTVIASSHAVTTSSNPTLPPATSVNNNGKTVMVNGVPLVLGQSLPPGNYKGFTYTPVAQMTPGELAYYQPAISITPQGVETKIPNAVIPSSFAAAAATQPVAYAGAGPTDITKAAGYVPFTPSPVVQGNPYAPSVNAQTQPAITPVANRVVPQPTTVVPVTQPIQTASAPVTQPTNQFVPPCYAPNCSYVNPYDSQPLPTGVQAQSPSNISGNTGSGPSGTCTTNADGSMQCTDTQGNVTCYDYLGNPIACPSSLNAEVIIPLVLIALAGGAIYMVSKGRKKGKFA